MKLKKPIASTTHYTLGFRDILHLGTGLEEPHEYARVGLFGGKSRSSIRHVTFFSTISTCPSFPGIKKHPAFLFVDSRSRGPPSSNSSFRRAHENLLELLASAISTWHLFCTGASQTTDWVDTESDSMIKVPPTSSSTATNSNNSRSLLYAGSPWL